MPVKLTTNTYTLRKRNRIYQSKIRSATDNNERAAKQGHELQRLA